MNKNIIYVVLLLGLTGYYGYDQLYPEYKKWGEEIATLKGNISSARSNAPKLAQIKEEELELKKRLKVSLEKLPSASELSDLLVMLTPIMEKAGISSSDIASKNVELAVEKDIYRVHPIRINGIKGLKISQIVRLIYEIRQFHRIVNITNLSMSRTGKAAYDLDLNLETYSYIAGEGEDLLNLPEEQTPLAPNNPEPVQASESADTSVATDTGVPTDTSALQKSATAHIGSQAGKETSSSSIAVPTKDTGGRTR